jgi:hypothetical protein
MFGEVPWQAGRTAPMIKAAQRRALMLFVQEDPEDFSNVSIIA